MQYRTNIFNKCNECDNLCGFGVMFDGSSLQETS